MAETYFERPYATIGWDASFEGIYIRLWDYIPSESYREVLEKALEYLRLKHVDRWLLDISEQKVTSLADQDWVATDFVPRCKEAGVGEPVIVLPKDIISKMAVNRIDRNIAPASPNYPAFASVEEARQWLINKVH